MSASLASRLLAEGEVPRSLVLDALGRHVGGGEPFLAALARLLPAVLTSPEALGLPGGDAVLDVDHELGARLPAGMLTALQVVALPPVGPGPARFATADPRDGHAVAELTRTLGGPVVLVQASPRSVARGLAALLAPPEARPSEPPFPLIRASLHPVEGPRTVPGVAPQALAPRGARPAPVVVHSGVTVDPVLALTRPKAQAEPPPPVTRRGVGADRAPAADGGLAEASSAEEVAAALARAAAAYGRECLVFAAQRDRFVGKEATTASLRARARALTIPASGPSVLATAAKTGPYLGPLPTTPVHRALAEALGDPDDVVAVVAVSLAGRPALVLVIAGMPLPAQAMEQAERLASLAATRLEAIVRERRP